MSDIIELNETVAIASDSRLSAYLELTKPRIASLVLVATAAGFYLAWPIGSDLSILPLLLHAIIGTALVASGANACNQFLEAGSDAKMTRTAGRPIPSGRLSPSEVRLFGGGLAVVGAVYLAVFTNPLACALAISSFLAYVFVYTPLKRVSSICVFVGAIPGALPPVIGWAAATGSVSLEAWILFGIVFVWQLPHVAAIAYLHREDYRRAGTAMIPVIDESGLWTDFHVITHSIGLLAVSLFPTFHGSAGAEYGIGAAILGLAFLGCGVWFLAKRTRESARFHLFASITYLPAIFAFLLIDKTWLA